MDRIKKGDFTLDILAIDNISGDGGIFEISFITKANESYKIIFDGVCDLQYTIELANVLRFEHIDDFFKDEGIFVVEKSKRIEKYIESGLEDIRGKLTHYVIMDATDTVADVICTSTPILQKLDRSEEEYSLEEENKYLKWWKRNYESKKSKGSDNELLAEQEVEQLRWWKDNENISVIQKELEELRAYKLKREREDKKAREDELKANSFGF